MGFMRKGTDRQHLDEVGKARPPGEAYLRGAVAKHTHGSYVPALIRTSHLAANYLYARIQVMIVTLHQ